MSTPLSVELAGPVKLSKSAENLSEPRISGVGGESKLLLHVATPPERWQVKCPLRNIDPELAPSVMCKEYENVLLVQSAFEPLSKDSKLTPIDPVLPLATVGPLFAKLSWLLLESDGTKFGPSVQSYVNVPAWAMGAARVSR